MLYKVIYLDELTDGYDHQELKEVKKYYRIDTKLTSIEKIVEHYHEFHDVLEVEKVYPID